MYMKGENKAMSECTRRKHKAMSEYVKGMNDNPGLRKEGRNTVF